MSDYSGPFPQPLPPAAAVLTGYQTFAATAGATTVVTVPAGDTWVGTVSLSCACVEAAAGAVQASALGVVSVAGAGATPPAGNLFAVQAVAGANAATGLTGTSDSTFGSIPLVVVAPAANAVTVQVTVTITGTSGRVDCTAAGLVTVT